MPTPQELRARGRDGLAELLALRPEVIGPPAPRSLAELAARLDHPMALSVSLCKLRLPDLQVAAVLAALGERAGRRELERLLGAESVTGAGRAIDEALAALDARSMLRPGTCRLDPALEDGWPMPLGLGPRFGDLLHDLTVSQLQTLLANWGVSRPPGARKADLLAALRNTVVDGPRVRAVVATAPHPLPGQLVDAALGRHVFEDLLAPLWRAPNGARSPLHWALDRLVLVPDTYDGPPTMPAEIALALRGPAWRAHFTPESPGLASTRIAAHSIEHESGVAGREAVRMAGDLLRCLIHRPRPLLKNGGVGLRELQRLSKELSTSAPQVRFLLALGHHLRLLDLSSGRLASTAAGSSWLNLPPARALAVLTNGWMTLADIPLDDPDVAWEPVAFDGAVSARHLILGLMAERGPGAAPDVDDLVALAGWAQPLTFGHRLSTIGVSGPDTDGPIAAVLAEAALLGVTGAGALSPAGLAAFEGQGVDAVESAASAAVGPAQETVALQADLTATVLGHAAGELVTTLDLMADRESRSTATVWRFSAASIRRALDAGYTAADLLARLTEISVGGLDRVPQVLTYLIEDAGRRHGRLRAGDVASYLRSEDAALLAEVSADRRLRKLGLRLLAPTVAVSSAAREDLVAALRTAGYSPMPEAADGTALGRLTADAPVDRAVGTTSSRRSRSRKRPPDPAALAADLLGAPDRAGHLLELGDTVIDASSLAEYSRNGPRA